MNFKDFKLTVMIYIAVYWNNETALKYIMGVLATLIALLFYLVYDNPTPVSVFFLILFIVCLVLTAIHYKNLKPGFPKK